jgi:HAE1 family hydrophobic/amphiphilic exporter-1
VEIYCNDRPTLEKAAGEVLAEMKCSNLFKDVQSSISRGNPEVLITFNREKMSRMGLSIGTVANSLRDKIQGATPTRFIQQGRDVDILVRLNEEDRRNDTDLAGLTVGYSNNTPIYLSSIAAIKHQLGPSQIRRIEKRRAAVISSGITGNDLGAATTALEPILKTIEGHFEDTRISVSGQSTEMKQSFKSLLFAIALAIFLVYLVMASQFESLFHPFLILFTVPMGLLGGLLGLKLMGMELSVVALIGLVMLAGIVVNNAIVLIDYINQLRRGGKDLYESLIEGGFRRMRPILMTTSTTVLGLLPMAAGLGEGAEIRAPLAITVIGGLLISTLLTLIVIPVLYGTFSRGLVIPAENQEGSVR